MSQEDARWWGNYLFKVGWFCFATSWLAMMAVALFGMLTTDEPWGGAPPIWMFIPPFVGLALILVSIAVEEIGGAWKHD